MMKRKSLFSINILLIISFIFSPVISSIEYSAVDETVDSIVIENDDVLLEKLEFINLSTNNLVLNSSFQINSKTTNPSTTTIGIHDIRCSYIGWRIFEKIGQRGYRLIIGISHQEGSKIIFNIDFALKFIHGSTGRYWKLIFWMLPGDYIEGHLTFWENVDDDPFYEEYKNYPGQNNIEVIMSSIDDKIEFNPDRDSGKINYNTDKTIQNNLFNINKNVFQMEKISEKEVDFWFNSRV